MQKYDSIFKEVLEKIEPPKETIKFIDNSLKDFLKKINKKIKFSKVDAEVFIGGSFAKKTVIKKDYYDVAELLNRYSFKQLLGFYEEKYPEYSTRNVIDVIKEIPRRNIELEKSPEPNTYGDINWQDVKQKVFDAFDTFRHDELQAKIEEMKKRHNR